MIFLDVFLGVATGIFVGVQTNLLINALRNHITYRKLKKELKFEVEFNIKKINSFINKLKEYQEHINGKSPYEYFGEFKISGVLKTTLRQMFSDRSIYKFYDYENISRFQTFLDDFQPQTQEKINDNIQKFREIEDADKMRKLANKFIEYLEEELKGAKNNLEAVKMKKAKF